MPCEADSDYICQAKDNGDTYSGFGLYVDDLVKCADDRWRIQTLRLTYRRIDGKLR